MAVCETQIFRETSKSLASYIIKLYVDLMVLTRYLPSLLCIVCRFNGTYTILAIATVHTSSKVIT